MKKKLLVSLLAAGLVLPSAAALAEQGTSNTAAELEKAILEPTAEEKAAAAAKADKEFAEKVIAEFDVASADKGAKLEDGVYVYSPTGEVKVDKAGVEKANVVKPMPKKVLPKTSAVK